MVLVADDTFREVRRMVSEVSGVPEGSIAPADVLKTSLGMNKPDLVRLTGRLTQFIQTFHPAHSLAFEVVDKKNQTVGGVATAVHATILG